MQLMHPLLGGGRTGCTTGRQLVSPGSAVAVYRAPDQASTPAHCLEGCAWWRFVQNAWISAAHDMPSQPALVPGHEALRCLAVVLWLPG